MTEPELVAQILALVEGTIEDARVPDAIAAYADKRAGKSVTKTDAKQLEEQLGIPIGIDRRHGMTHVTWATGSILIAYAETGVVWPTGEELRQKATAYFGARDERNAQRRALLKEHRDRKCVCRAASDTCSGCWPDAGQNPLSAVTRVAKAVIKYREAREEMAALLDYGAPLSVIKYPLKKIAEDE